MTPLDRLDLCVPSDELYPADMAYMARTSLSQTRLLGYLPRHRDAVTTVWMGLFGRRASVRHRSGVSDEILRFFEAAGLVFEEDLRVYATGEQAERHADALVEAGHRLMGPYPLPEGRYPLSAQLVAPDVWRRLNAKRHLDRIVPTEHLAPRRIVDVGELPSLAFTGPVFVKSASELATGWGHAVRACETRAQLVQAARELTQASGEREIIVEQALPVSACWCVNIVVAPERTRFVGAAEQLFSSPGQQSGSIIDPDAALPPEGAALAVKIGEAAAADGFIGIAGLDIGRTPDGRLYVFDPNFRGNACTSQVLLHASAARRADARVSHSVAGRVPLGMRPLLAALEAPMREGWLVPTRLLDAALLDAAEGHSQYDGFVLGRDRREAVARAREIAARVTAAERG